MARKQRRQKRKRGAFQPKNRYRKAPTLSLCMIARDEAGFLRSCLKSVAGLVDEILVGDTGSSDPTAGVAESFGATVLDIPWTGDFSEARNQVLAASGCDWILVLDCDEVIAARDLDGIRRAAASGRADAYRLTTRNYVRETNRVGRQVCSGDYPDEERDHTGWFPTTKVRLFRNVPEFRFRGALHELVESSVMEAGGRIADVSAAVHHFGYVDKPRPVAAYAEAARRKVEAEPDSVDALYELALALRDTSDLPGASEAIVRCLGLLSAGEKGQYVRHDYAYLVQGDLCGRMGDPAGAEAACGRALAIDAACYPALNNLGAIRQKQGDLDGALDCYERALALAATDATIADNVANLRKRLGKGARVGPKDAARPRRLTVCLIVRNEEAVLDRCLKSVASIADEIVVVDTGSSDSSLAIAERYSAVTGHFAWCDDFAAARNASLELATGDWVLWMDADDYLRPEDAEKVRKAAAMAPDQALLATLINEGEDHSEFRQVKMFPNREAVRFERPVHESVIPSLMREAIPIVATDIEVRHTGYAKKAVRERKEAYYLDLMRQWVAGHPEDGEVHFRIGHTMYNRGETAEALVHFERAASCPSGGAATSLRRMASVFLGRCLVDLKRYEDARPVLAVALELGSDDALAHATLGETHLGLGDLAAAAEHLERALSGTLDPNFPADASAFSESVRSLLWQTYRRAGRKDEARRLFPDGADGAAAMDRLWRTTPVDGGVVIDKDSPIALPAERRDGPTLSICMIVRNEGHRLGRCLDSVKGIADEIVVVDTGSTDDTVDVARRHGARMGAFEWCEDFAAARNVSLEMATSDYILWLDADDVVPKGQAKEIRRLLRKEKDKAYYFILDSQGYEPISCLQLRMFPNRDDVRFEMPIHEQLTPSLSKAGITCEVAEIRVVHTGYTTPDVVRRKQDRYLKIMEAWLREHPGDYIVRSHAARTYHIQGKLDRAIQEYRTILEDSDCHKDNNLVVETTAWLYLGRSLMRKEAFEEALPTLQKALEMDDQYAVTWVTLGECHTRMGQRDEAIRCLEKALEFENQTTFASNDPQALKYSIRFFLGQNFESANRLEDAVDWYRQASEVDPNRSGALGALSTACRKMGRREEAVSALEKAMALDPENPKHLFNRGTYYMEEGDLDEAERLFRRVGDADPDMPEVYLNLGFVVRRKGDLRGAEELYRRACDLNPSSVDPAANLAHLLLDQGRYEDALEWLQRVSDLQPGLLDMELGFCVACSALGRTRDVSASVNRILPQIYGEDMRLSAVHDLDAAMLAQLLSECGRMLLQKHLAVCARLAYLAAHTLDPSAVAVGLQLAEVHRVTGHLPAAIAVCEAMLLKYPEEPELFRKLGACYADMNVPAAAEMCERQVAALETR